MNTKITWHGTNGGNSIVGYVGGFHMFRICKEYNGSFLSFRVTGYTVRTEVKQESGKTYGYTHLDSLVDAKNKAEEMWKVMLDIFKESK